MTNPKETTIIQISSGTIIKTILILFVTYLVFFLKDLVLALLASIVIASAIEPFTNWFVSRRVPRTVAVISIYFLLATVMAGIVYLFIPPVLNDIKELAGNLPEYISTISDKSSILNEIPVFNQFINELNTSVDQKLFLQNSDGGVAGTTLGFVSMASSVFGGVISFILIFVLSFYFSVQENGIYNFLRIITPIQYEKYILDLWTRSKRKIGLWMQGQMLLGVLVGVLTFLGLSILGIKNAFFLAIVAGMFEIIPVFGPIMSAIPAIAIAIPQGGITLGLLVAGLYIIIQQFENHLFYPLVVKKIVGIPALISIISLIVGAKLAGFIGMLLSVPVAAAIMEYILDVERRKLAEIKTHNNQNVQ